ncbi:hypothetical protein [Neomicrococcus lactis]|uniref:Uncharacterized protein n=1 Tax=Neomicrococcus lactis TaxID=732241 RepID=A0A7W8YAZ4_9MICC|nr:hypothetical protein [Neomicrococcus lactis]MBB5598081.1 hypothetical protein [Neomicrococcus lactis]
MERIVGWQEFLPLISGALVACILISSLIAIIVFDRRNGILNAIQIFSYTVFFLAILAGMSYGASIKITDPSLRWIGWAHHIYTSLVVIYFSKRVLVFPKKEFDSKVYAWVVVKQEGRSYLLATILIFLCVFFGPILYVIVVLAR